MVSPWLWKAVRVAWILFLTVVSLRLADRLIQKHGAKLSAALPLTSLTQGLAKGIIWGIGGLILLDAFGISITPLLAALGVGGLAVALGLQDTLTNLFSGIYITIARKIRVGDYIKLDTGEEGYVVDIAWRSTRIRSLSNNLIIVPNTKLAQAIVTNYDLPTQDQAVLVELGIDYGSDLEKVERVTSEVAKEVMRQVAGGVPSFEPFVRYHTFSDAGIQFTVILRGSTFVDQYLVKHEFLKRIHRRYAKEGITLPSSLRTLILNSSAQPPR
ncbi:MAG: mechanosensitive ion channel family protein [Candidatus Omnitrophica bacterium]|nr:mechanosensitive ion channel family protein [Candidatus Omnitrophota bacterium]